jgi:hypothetical protein
MSVASMVRTLEDHYETYNVHKCLLVCKNETELQALAKELRDNHHTVCLVEDERIFKANMGGTGYRVLGVTLSDIDAYRTDIERWVLPEHNLIAFGNIPPTEEDIIEKWVCEANRRGFKPDLGDTKFLCL